MTIYEAIGGFVVIFLASVGAVTLGLLVWQGARTTVKVVEGEAGNGVDGSADRKDGGPMSKHTYTPKQWTFRVKSEGNGFNVCENDSPFAVVHMTNDPSVAEARVRLTATAPELLAALYDVRRECILPSHIEAIVGAAIAKAERGS